MEDIEGVITDSLAKNFDRLRGRFLGLIESWGLEERHETGAKSTFKSLSYDMQEAIADDIIAIIEPIE